MCTGCIYGNKCFFRHVEAEEKPSKKSKKGGLTGSVALLKESYTIGLCVSWELSEKICSTGRRKIGIGTWHQRKIREKRVHREDLFKSVNFMSVVLARLSVRRGHKRRSCTKKGAPAEQHETCRKC